MPQFNVNINGRNYVIACDEGQEEHIGRLADYVKVRVEELVDSVGQVGDARLLLMASLLVSDELSDAYADIAAAGGEPGGLAGGNRGENSAEAAADSLEALADRAEAIAERLEAT